MRLIAAKNKLIVGDTTVGISCNVRTVRDGTRRSYETVLSIPSGKPYDPRPFPKGLWRITGVEWQRDTGFNYATYGPVKIRTDAGQYVKVWELDSEGDYLRETDELVWDEAYWLHYSQSMTTLGCFRFASDHYAIRVAEIVEQFLRKGELVELEV
jgi:hypothetical protein